MTIDLRAVAHRSLDFIGGERPRVQRSTRDDGEYWVDIAEFRDRPVVGVTSWATIGMSNYPTAYESDGGVPIRVELVGACASDVLLFPNILGTCAFNVGTGEYGITPGTIFPRVVELYLPAVRMKHMLFVPPYLWGNTPADLDTGGVTVTWLMTIPVSDSEFELARSAGVDTLEQALEDRQVDIYDLDRPSVVPDLSTDSDPWA